MFGSFYLNIYEKFLKINKVDESKDKELLCKDLQEQIKKCIINDDELYNSMNSCSKLLIIFTEINYIFK